MICSRSYSIEVEASPCPDWSQIVWNNDNPVLIGSGASFTRGVFGGASLDGTIMTTADNCTLTCQLQVSFNTSGLIIQVDSDIQGNLLFFFSPGGAGSPTLPFSAPLIDGTHVITILINVIACNAMNGTFINV